MIDISELNQGEFGTALSQTLTATASWTKTFNWTILETVNPKTLNLFRGDTGTAQYTISVTNDEGTNTAFISGKVCITNTGDVPAEGLMSMLEVTSPVNSTIIATANLVVSIHPVLAPGETFCYPYTININSFVTGQSFIVTADTTITNYLGYNKPFGPSTNMSGSFPAKQININETINVTDTNLKEQTLNFTAISGGGNQSVGYNKVFDCKLEGRNENTATITQTGQTSSATVTVKCHDLIVKIDADTSFTRTYKWRITKVAVDPVSNVQIDSLTLAANEQYVVRYIVKVTPAIMDSDFIVSGIITVSNPNPDKNAIVSMSDIISTTGGNVTVTPSPETVVIPAGGKSDFTYSNAFETLTTGTSQAFAAMQNNTGLTTTFNSMPAPFDFSNAKINEIDSCVNVVDSFKGQLNVSPVCRVPMTFTYDRTIGPFANCSDVTNSIDNTATFMNTTAFGSASFAISVTVPCAGCTLTIDYWKTHTGLKTSGQPNAVGSILAKSAINLGTEGGPRTAVITAETQVAAILNFKGWSNLIPGPTLTSDASNGISRLYAQLLAAKLNIANGAHDSAILGTIKAADDFLAAHDTRSWVLLSDTEKTQVNTWQSLLEGYNAGLTGPGNCSEQNFVSSALLVTTDVSNI